MKREKGTWRFVVGTVGLIVSLVALGAGVFEFMVTVPGAIPGILGFNGLMLSIWWLGRADQNRG